MLRKIVHFNHCANTCARTTRTTTITTTTGQRLLHTLSYTTFGDEDSKHHHTPVILLHGLLGNRNHWRPLLTRKESFLTLPHGETVATTTSLKRYAYAVDMRNHGDSFHSNVMNYEAMAMDLEDFIERQGLKKVILIGHSMGGKAILHLCLSRALHRTTSNNFVIEKCVIGDISPVSYLDNPRWAVPTMLQAMKELPLDFTPHFKTRQDVDQELAKYIPDARVRLLLAFNLDRRSDRSGWKWNVNLPVIYDSLHHMGGFPEVDKQGVKYDGSVLFVRGGASFYCHSPYEQQIDTLFSNYQIETIPGAGHWIHSDAPDQFSDIVRRYINHHPTGVVAGDQSSSTSN